MKQYISYLSFVGALALSLFGCTKEEESDIELQQDQQMEQQGEQSVWQVTIDALKGSDEVKALAYAGSKITATWTAGDVVRAWKDGVLLGELTAQSSGARTKISGTLTGDLSLEDELTLYYSHQQYDLQEGTLEYIANNCDGADATVTIIGFDNGSVITSSATFQSRQSITRFTFVDQDNNTVIPDYVVIRQKITSDTGGYWLTAGPVTGHDDDLGSRHLGSLIVRNESHTGNLFVAMDGYDIKTTYYFVLYVGSDIYVGEKKAKLIEGKFYTASVPVALYQPTYVDMGLSVKWASCNLGAYYPEAPGDYYAWGEITPKTEFYWSNYKWGYIEIVDNTVTTNAISKYNTSDKLTTLQLEDDAAHQKLGLGWWMPTANDWEELFDATKCEWRASLYSNMGYWEVRSKITGNYLVLPMAGVIEDNVLSGCPYNDMEHLFLSGVERDGTSGSGYAWYWSSSLAVGRGVYRALFTEISYSDGQNYSSDLGMWYEYRKYGMPVRPVYVEPVTAVSFDQASFTLPCLDYSLQLSYTKTPESGTPRVVNWVSSNPSVATVDQSGKVTSVSRGTATITVTMDGEVTASCTVTVQQSSENFLRYKRNYKDASYTNKYDADKDREYSSRLTGFNNASVIEMKFKLNGTGCLGSGNRDQNGAYISVLNNRVECRDNAGNVWSFPIADYGIAASDLMILKYDGRNHTFTINGHTESCPTLTTFTFTYMLAAYYDNTADSEIDDDDELLIIGIPNDSKVFYIRAYNASNSLIRSGSRSSSTATNSLTGQKEYYWSWSTSEKEFASYTDYNANTYEPFGAQ